MVIRGVDRFNGKAQIVETKVQYLIPGKINIAIFLIILPITWGLLWLGSHANWQGWLLCHWAFALHWSALQYVDHAWSPRDIINGAWNLKVLPISRLFALNYHYHLAHHRYPTVPWIHLPKLLNSSEPQPTFWSIYFSLWGGTRPAPPMGS